MAARANNRLLVVGPGQALDAFSESAWLATLGARHSEILEYAHGRAAWQFDTESGPPLRQLAALSLHWPALTFVLVYDQEEAFIMGLAKIKTGTVKHHRIRY